MLKIVKALYRPNIVLTFAPEDHTMKQKPAIDSIVEYKSCLLGRLSVLIIFREANLSSNSKNSVSCPTRL